MFNIYFFQYSDSRSSSFSRRDDRRHRRRSSHSRSRQRPIVHRRDDNRTISPNRRQRPRSPNGHRSPSYHNRRRPSPTINYIHSSNHQRLNLLEKKKHFNFIVY